MFKILNENKIVGVVEQWTDSDKEIHQNLIAVEDTEHQISDYVMVGEEYVLDTDEKTIAKKNQDKIAKNEEYLKSTDWYAIRFADTGEEIPEDIKKARQDARDEISRLRGK